MNANTQYHSAVTEAIIERALHEKKNGAETQYFLEQFRKTGLSVAGNESWKYTSLSFLTAEQFNALEEKDNDIWVENLCKKLSSHPVVSSAHNRVVMVNGVFKPHYSKLSDTLKIEELPWEMAVEKSQYWRNISPATDHTLLTLNEILARRMLSIHVPKSEQTHTLILIDVTTGEGQGSVHPHYCVNVENGARLELIEIAQGNGSYVHNGVSKIKVGKNAFFSHVRALRHSTEAVTLDSIYADIEEKGEYNLFSSIEGTKLQRTDVKIGLNGAHAIAHVNGVQLLGNHSHGDITSYISHAAPHTASRQTIKNVISKKGKGVFQGKIYVDRIAQKTDGYQMNQALLLSEEAELDAKPELEIYADDVKCSHGATAGALDEEQLFYLCSRGIPILEAKKMLVEAFITDAYALVENESIQQFIEEYSNASSILA